MTTKTSAITKSYLMWIGSEHYEGINVYSDEAVTLGVSKRLPSVAAGRALMEPGTVVFVAHDEGSSSECPECRGTIECPQCRIRRVESLALQAEVDTIKSRFEDFAKEAPAGKKRSVRIREAKIVKLSEASGACEDCGGTGKVESSTGGYVVLKDGSRMDYRQYNYWLHQPKKWDDSKVKERHQCEECGGKGLLPDGKVFGMFVPDRVEYIVSGEETKEKMEEVKDFAAVSKSELVLEPRRGCGKRKVGGVYAVTVPGEDSKKAQKAVDELVESGIIEPEGVDLHGSFVRFLNPIAIDEKRFRGIKSWALDARVETEAEMAAEALED